MRKGHGVVEVHRLALSLGTVGVDEDDFGGQSAQQQSIGKGRPDIAGADDGNSRGMGIFLRGEFRHS